MNFLVNKNGESTWHKVDAISGEDAIKSIFDSGIILFYKQVRDITIFDNLEGTQLYAVKEIKDGN